MMDAQQRGVRSQVWMSGFFFTLLLLFSLSWTLCSSADQAQYFYDELGRLVGVVDGQGHLATYEYDQVGNLLSVTRGAATAPVITTLSPNPIEAGGSTPMTLTGSGLLLGTVTTSNPDILINPLPGNTDTLLEATLTIPNPTVFGATTVTVNGPEGSADTTLTVTQPVPTINNILPASNGLIGATVVINGTGFGTRPGSNHVTFAADGGGRIEATILSESFTEVSVKVPVGAVSGNVTVEVGSLTSQGMPFDVVDPQEIPVTARMGVPTNSAEPSVNAGQRVGVVGVGFVEGATAGTIPTLDANGAPGSAVVSWVNVRPDGTFAQVIVPALATTGVWTLNGTLLDGVRVQVVPTLTALQGTVVAGSPLDILGSGFQEGDTTVFFPGSAGGISAPDVTGANNAVTVVVPSGLLSDGLVTVRTVGGTSNPLSVGPPVFLGINSTASSGTPFDPTVPSARPLTSISLQGLNLSNGLPVALSTTSDAGIPSFIVSTTSNTCCQGRFSSVNLPLEVTTGPVHLGPWEVPLQIVPLLSFFDDLPAGTLFETGTVLTLRGQGFKEGATTVAFTGGGAPVLASDVFTKNYIN